MHCYCFPVDVRAHMEHIVNWILWTVINHNHSAVRFFCNMSCHLCFSRFPSNILQSPEAPESINLDRWVFYGARRYIRSHTQTRCRVHILTNWWDRFVAYKWHQFDSPVDAIGLSTCSVCVSVHPKAATWESLLSIFSIIKSFYLVYVVLMFYTRFLFLAVFWLNSLCLKTVLCNLTLLDN